MTTLDSHDVPAAAPYPMIGRSASVGVARTLVTSYRVVLRQLFSTARIVALVALSLTAVIAGFAVGTSDTATVDDGAAVIANLGFAVVIPVVTLVFGGAAIGDLREDKTLVYLWLRPMSRWPIVVGAALAALTMSAPITLPTVVLAAALTGVGDGIVGATLLASVVALLAYVAIFTMLGVWLKRYVVWGLAYILIWEGFIALGGEGVAQFAIRKYTGSILADQTGADLRLAGFATSTAVVIPLLVTVAAIVVATWRLDTQDVD